MNDAAHPRYAVAYVEHAPSLDADWNSPEWNRAATLQVAHFHPASSDHRPKTEAKMVQDGQSLTGIFRVEDRYVVCAHTAFQSPVYKDSCVEFFVRPKASKGYFNFEMNGCGALLAQYIQDPVRTPDGFAKFTKLPPEMGDRVRVRAFLHSPLAVEHAESLTWTLSFRIPFEILEAYVGRLGELCGQEWRANFHKCADGSSHPHWGAWAPMGAELNFHAPDRFGVLIFEQ